MFFYHCTVRFILLECLLSFSFACVHSLGKITKKNLNPLNCSVFFRVEPKKDVRQAAKGMPEETLSEKKGAMFGRYCAIS
jgi:hypothetical protein